MSLLIVAAKDTNEALELLSTKPKKAIKTHFVEEFEGIDNFLYDFKDEFLHYEIYYRFDPYRETYLEASSVCKIKIFSGSILQWITENCAKENTLISRYGITLNKIKNFAIGLNNVCDVAIKNKYGLVGIGDANLCNAQVEYSVLVAFIASVDVPAHWRIPLLIKIALPLRAG